MMKKTKIMVLLILLFLTGCTITGQVVYQIPEEQGPPLEIYFCPQDNCEEKFLEITKEAKTLDCAFFDLELEKMITRLEKENKNEKQSNLDVHYDNNRNFMHDKFCIIDEKIIMNVKVALFFIFIFFF